MVILEDEADVLVAEAGELRVGEGEWILVVQDDLAGGRAIERAEDLEERALAGAGGAEDRESFARGDAQIDAAEHRQRAGPGRVRFVEALGDEGMFGHLACFGREDCPQGSVCERDGSTTSGGVYPRRPGCDRPMEPGRRGQAPPLVTPASCGSPRESRSAPGARPCWPGSRPTSSCRGPRSGRRGRR